VGEHRQLGRAARAFIGDTEHPVADGDTGDARTDLVDDARHFRAQRLR
jgi:hypothetical protein